MRVEEALAGGAAKTRPWRDVVLVGEGVSLHELLLARLPASWAATRSVELVLLQDGWSQDVLVPFEQLPGNLGVELLEGRHHVQVQRVGDQSNARCADQV